MEALDLDTDPTPDTIVRLLFARAIGEGAEELRIAPERVELIKDGAVESVPPPPAHYQRALEQRLCAMADLPFLDDPPPRVSRIHARFRGVDHDLEAFFNPVEGGLEIVLKVPSA